MASSTVAALPASSALTGTELFYSDNGSADVKVTSNQIKTFATPAGAALTKTDDTNVTLTLGGTPASALLVAASLTLGWTGTLAAARLNSGVVQAVTNDTNVTGSIAAQNLTLGWTGTLALSRLAQGTDGQIIVGQTSASPLYKTASGDLTIAASGAFTLANTIAAGGPTGSATVAPIITYDAKGRLTAVSSATITPAASSITGGAVLSKVDDTNVTLTLGGAPTTALLTASSITVGWTGTLSLSRGGTAASLAASNGGIVYSGAAALAVLSGTATANQLLLSGSSAAPAWSTATYPPTTTINQLLYSSSANVVAGLATVNGGLLNAGATGIPALTVTPVLGLAGTSKGTLGLSGNTSGVVTIQPAAAAGTYNFNLPIAAGSAGDVLTSQGGGSTAMTWTTPGAASMAIGSAVTSGTTGSLLFVGAGPVLAQDNSNLFWDDTNNFLGLGTATPKVTLDNKGSLSAGSFVAVSSTPYTVAATDYFLLVDTSGAAITIDLPSAASFPGRQIYVKRKNNYTTFNGVYLAPNGADKIDGVASTWTDALYTSYAGICLVSDGSAGWWSTGSVQLLADGTLKGLRVGFAFNDSLYLTENWGITVTGLNATTLNFQIPGSNLLNWAGGGATPSYNFSLVKEVNGSLGVERSTTAATVGAALTLQAGGATSGSTDKNGGALTLVAGTSTGTGTANVIIQAPVPGTTGTADHAAATVATFSGTTANLLLIAGIAACAPLKFTSGTNLTTAAAGAMEYDGTCFYATAAASSRQLADAEQFLSLSATQTATSGNAAQVWFPGGGATKLTVQASTTYFFEGLLLLANGTTTHTTSLTFALAASASLTSIAYDCVSHRGAINATGTNFNSVTVNQATATVIDATTTSAGLTARVRGIMRVNAGGTVEPQFTWSANPTGTNQVLANTYFRMWPAGSNTVLNVGNWS